MVSVPNAKLRMVNTQFLLSGSLTIDQEEDGSDEFSLNNCKRKTQDSRVTKKEKRSFTKMQAMTLLKVTLLGVQSTTVHQRLLKKQASMDRLMKFS